MYDKVVKDDFVSKLYTNYAEIMRRKAYGIVKDYHLAEDAVQMTFASVYKNLDKIELDITNKMTLGYVYTILENKSYNILRDNKKYQYIEAEEDTGFLGQESDEHILENISCEAILNIIYSMPSIYSQILILYCVHEHSFKEISEILEISEVSARQRLHRARLRLKDLLKQEQLI